MLKLRDLFAIKPKHWLGIDLTTNYIRLAELSVSRGDITILNIVKQQINVSGFNDGYISDFGYLTSLIKNILQTNNIKAKASVIALDDHLVQIKQHKLPNAYNQDELLLAVKADLMQQAIDLEQVAFDFYLSSDFSSDALSIDLVSLIVAQDLVQQYIKLAKATNLVLKVLDIKQYAIERCTNNWLVRQNLAPSNMLLVSLFNTKIHIKVYSNSKELIHHQAEFGIELFYQLLAKYLDINPAQLNKITYPIESQRKAQVEHNYLLALVQEINLVLSMANIDKEKTQFLAVVVLSEVVPINNFIDRLETISNIKFNLVNPLAGMRVNSYVTNTSLAELAPFATAVGLALRGIQCNW